MGYITLEHFMSGASCCSRLYSSKEGFLPITYSFLPGHCYGFFGDFGRGCWALATCLGGRGDEPASGKIYWNGDEIDRSEMQAHSCFAGENIVDSIDDPHNPLTANECIQCALHRSQLPYSVTDIKSLFRLSDERFDRDLRYVSGEIWRISIAIGFALNRELFCYPWMNVRDAKEQLDAEIIEVLKAHQKIIVIPTCRAVLKTPFKKVFDHTIDFHSYKEKCFDISPEARKQLRKMEEW